MSQNQGHPLPAPPGQEQRPVQQRARAKSTFSFHSHKSSGSGSKDLTETHEEKNRLHSKADPSMAITEAEPSAVAREASSLADIRAIQHRDNQGNPIAEPDRSNPTRSRWERPLDTIRSFEAAVDGNYSRKSYLRSNSSEAASSYNRRSSYFGGTQASTDERSKYSQHGYYGGGRTSSHRPESAYMDGSRGLEGRSNGIPRPDVIYNSGEGAGPSNGYHPNRARHPRTTSEPHFAPGGGVYHQDGNPASYETVTSGSGSSAEPAGYSTDPSSENGSVDRIAPAPRESAQSYGFNGVNSQYLPPGSGPNEQYTANGGPVQQGNGYTRNGPPPVPRKQGAGPRAPIQLGTSSGNVPVPEKRPVPPEKRKSWFGRKFSKA